MRILVCAAEAPIAPLNGFRLQLRPVCEQLARNHEVVVLSPRRPGQEGDHPAGVELRCFPFPRTSLTRRGVTSLICRDPVGVVAAHGPMERALEEILAQRSFDVVHVAGWPLAGLGRSRLGVPQVLTALDAQYLNYRTKSLGVRGPLRLMYRREAARVRRFEREAYPRFSSVVVVTDEDAAALRALDPAIAVEVVPNGVDSDLYAPQPVVEAEAGLVVFTGAMHWAPNVEAARFLAQDVFPGVRDEVPHAHLAIVGRSPARTVTALGSLDGVQVTGEVPAIRDWLVRAQVFVCPMVGGTGIKNKLLEAMACGLPCVVTPLACQGLSVRDGEHVLVADGAAAMATQIARLLNDGALRDRLGAAARECVVQRHSWQVAGKAYESLLLAAIDSHSDE